MPLTRQRLKELHRLLRRKGRERVRQFLVEGVRSVEAAVQAKAPLVEVLVTHEAAEDVRVIAVLDTLTVPVHTLPTREMARLTDTQTDQGLLGVATSVVADDLAALDAAQTVLVLDGVQDPGNVGTLIRTAAWFGAEAVLAGPGTADLESPKVVRSAMGGLWDLRLVRTDDLGAALARLADRMPIVGADLAGEPAARWQPPEAGALVLGSEAHGLSEATQQHLTARVCLKGHPPRKGVESLNVAVAGGILLHRWLGV
ncbi:MAG: RNA methyltransferase [Rhodothermaceae bacterium]|nr:RNA methyltransferase [Rhodothermaceae bacterium]